MPSICILTDSFAQFPQMGFSGRNEVRVIPFSVQIGNIIYAEGQDLRSNELAPVASSENPPRLLFPSVQEFQELFQNLSQHYSDVIVLLTSSKLTPAFERAHKASEFVRGRTRVSVIDTQTTSVGLGLLVQAAAEAAAGGQSAAEIERTVREMIQDIYMMICTPTLSYMRYAGIVDSGQAFVSDMLGLMPIFTLEEGALTAVEKVRNTRGLADFMQEFITEFEELRHLAFIQGFPPLTNEAKLMRDYAQDCFPKAPFSEHPINLPLAALIGPRSVGLVAVELR